MGIYSSPDENVFLGYFEGEDETQTNETDDSDESIDEGVESQTVFLNLSSIYQLNIADQPQSLPYTNSESQTLDVNFIVNGVNKGNSCYQEFEEGTTVSVEIVYDGPGGFSEEEAFWTDGGDNPRTFTMNTNITETVRIGFAE